MYKIGQFFSVEGTVAVLAQVAANKCALITLPGGNRCRNEIAVVDVRSITPDELERMTDRRVSSLPGGTVILTLLPE